MKTVSFQFVLLTQSLFSLITTRFLFTQKRNLTPRQHKAQMFLTNFSNFCILHTAGANLVVADMLGRDFSIITNNMWPITTKNSTTTNRISPTQKYISLKEVFYLVKHEDVLPTRNNDTHPILADNSDDQLTLRFRQKGNTNTFTPLKFLSFQVVSSFLEKKLEICWNKVTT